MSRTCHEEKCNIEHVSKGFWLWLGLLALTLSTGCSSAGPLKLSADPPKGGQKQYTKEDALRMIRASEGRLAPVYGPLAEQLVQDLGLKGKALIGIDLGSGPGTLIIELCKRTKGHWINADINPYFFPYFFQQAEKNGFGGRVSAIEADAQDLPFRDNYADVIVSRGSFWLWNDKLKAFGEILRVLKPGGVAYIGRGFSENLPIDVAKKVRGGQGRGMKYDVAKTADELRQIMTKLKIKDYRIIRPRLDNKAGVSYGVWVEFHKQK
jgi:SAM-dependent methyltransferase